MNRSISDFRGIFGFVIGTFSQESWSPTNPVRFKVDGKQNYQCKDCKRQFIGDHALSYLGCKSGITRKILQLMVRGSGIRDIAEVERISIGKVLRTLTESTYEIQPQQSHYESLEVDEFWNFVGNKKNKQWLIFVQKSYFTSEKPDIFIGENIDTLNGF
ncbi:transposase domain protein (plasmid) [Acinetobacter baumannii]|nr:transposase domain protein [Acinetobacter baumannii]